MYNEKVEDANNSLINHLKKHANHKSDVIVSVVCLAYNHEKYIKRALESFLIQKTTFKYEVIVYDDASTDKTTDIIREFQAEYPEILKHLYQSENQYQKGGFSLIVKTILPYINGKYVAACDGDDYWCDENKLQMQYNIMSANNDIVLCVHGVQCINEDGSLSNRTIPSKAFALKKDKKISPKEFVDIYHAQGIIFQASSYFYIKELLEKEEYFYLSNYFAGDAAIQCIAPLYGAVFYIHKFMSFYRIQSKGSWSVIMEKSPETLKEHVSKGCKGLLILDKQTNRIYHNQIIQHIYAYLFDYLIIYGQYKTVKNIILQENIKYKPKNAKSILIYMKCIALIYTPWLCRFIGVIYRACRKCLRGRNK